MIIIRAIVVMFVVFVVLLGKRLVHEFFEGRRERSRIGTAATLPATITEGRDRTWVLFTTPYCTSCRDVEAQLRSHDPGTPVVRIDASRELALAERFAIQSAPTLLLAGADGSVEERHVGATDSMRAAKASAR